MSSFIAIIVLVVVSLGVFNRISSLPNIHAGGGVLSLQTSQSPSPSSSPTPTPTPRPATPKPHPTFSNQPPYAPANTVPPTSNNSSSVSPSDWQYPNSSASSSDSHHLQLQSGDSPDTITDWYQTQIKNRHFQINTFVKTNSNDNIDNKLVGNGNGSQISIDITRSPGSSTTNISANF